MGQGIPFSLNHYLTLYTLDGMNERLLRFNETSRLGGDSPLERSMVNQLLSRFSYRQSLNNLFERFYSISVGPII